MGDYCKPKAQFGTSPEVGYGPTFFGAAVGWASSLADGPICAALGVTTDIGGVACVAAIVGTGAWVGTTGGAIAGEYIGEKVYEISKP